jgi:hypothetical protein
MSKGFLYRPGSVPGTNLDNAPRNRGPGVILWMRKQQGGISSGNDLNRVAIGQQMRTPYLLTGEAC